MGSAPLLRGHFYLTFTPAYNNCVITLPLSPLPPVRSAWWGVSSRAPLAVQRSAGSGGGGRRLGAALEPGIIDVGLCGGQGGLPMVVCWGRDQQPEPILTLLPRAGQPWKTQGQPQDQTSGISLRMGVGQGWARTWACGWDQDMGLVRETRHDRRKTWEGWGWEPHLRQPPRKGGLALPLQQLLSWTTARPAAGWTPGRQGGIEEGREGDRGREGGHTSILKFSGLEVLTGLCL